MILFPGRHLMGVLKCHHISYFEKWKLWAMFFGGFLRWSNYNRKKRSSCLAVNWNVWGFHQLGLFWQVPWSNYHRKKRYSRLAIGCNVWGVGSMSSDCFGGFVAMFFGGFLDQITNYDRKKRYSCLACLHHLQHT